MEFYKKLSENSKFKKFLVLFCFIFILALAAGLRFAGLDWDEEQHLHPDERFLTMVQPALKWPSSFNEYMDEQVSPLNPRNAGYNFFVYGSLPMTIVKGFSILMNKTDYTTVYLVGRKLSCLFDLASIIFLFFIARTLYKDNRIALLSSFFLATSVLAIQYSHFFVVDTFANFFVVLTIFFLARSQMDGRIIDFAMTGVSFGLAMASKISIFTLVLVIIMIAIFKMFSMSNEKIFVRAWKTLIIILLIGFLSLITFRISMPDAFRNPGIFNIIPSDRWLSNVNEVRYMMSGYLDFPPNHQWTNRSPIIFPWINMVFWGMGLPLGITAWIGCSLAGWRIIYRKEWQHLIPVVWTILLFLHQGTQWVKSMRYFLPIYPVLVLLGAWFLIYLLDYSRKKSVIGFRNFSLTWSPVKATILISIVSIGTLLWALAFTGIYTRPTTRVQASRWIYENIPPGSVIGNEHWDDPLPLRIDGKDPFGGNYTGLELHWYDDDNMQKYEQAVRWLDQMGYIVLSSNRLYGSITRLPKRYPMMIIYYKALFDGSLGFEKIADFTSYPQIFGIAIPDDWAEEAFSVYDHPRVQIFKKTSAYNSEKAKEILGKVNWDEIIRYTPREATRGGSLFISDEDWQKYRHSGTWAELFNRKSISNRVPLIIWIFVLELFGIIAFPYLFVTCSSLPDRGYFMTKTFGLLFISWFIWILSSLRILPFSSGAILCIIILTATGAIILFYKKWSEIKTFWILQKKFLIWEEALFLIFFALFTLIRWSNPDLWHQWFGGEKPMDLSCLNAVLKSPYFPPYDPWFARGYLNYYYFGFVFVGTLIKVTGILPHVAYNLAIPTLFAMTGLGAFGVTLSLVNKGSRIIRLKKAVIATFGAFFVCVIGNLGEIKLVLNGLAMLGRDSVEPGLFSYIIMVWNGFIHGYMNGLTLPINNEWWYWNATRLISYSPGEAGPINEFPWFTFLYGDLHAHAMALPLTLTVLGFIMTLLLNEKIQKLGIFFLALAIGSLWPTNTWDIPTYTGLLFFTLLLREWIIFRKSGSSYKWFRILIGAGWKCVLIVCISYLCYLPYHMSYVAGYNKFELWHGSRTPLGDYLLIHGFFLFLIITGMITDLWFGKYHNGLLRFFLIPMKHRFRLKRVIKLYRLFVKTGRVFWFKLLLVILLYTSGIVGSIYLTPLCGLFIILILSASLLLLKKRPVPLWQMSLAFTGMALMLSLMVEFIVLSGDISRMNTVFKFYFQVWVLFAIASASGISLIQDISKWNKFLKYAWILVYVIMFTSTALYPILATIGKINTRFNIETGSTFDGMAYMDKAIYNFKGNSIELKWDKEAMEWLQDNVSGTPVIAEINTCPDLYSWGNRYSVYTGLPSVVGWDWHERQKRPLGSELVAKRVNNIISFYNTSDPVFAYKILKDYDVDYIIVGPLEKVLASPEGIAKFEANEGILWTEVYKNPQVKIYNVIKMDLESNKEVLSLLKVPPPSPTPGVNQEEPYKSLSPVDPFKGGDGLSPGMFKSPRGMAIDNKDNLYVVDFRNNRIQIFNSSGKFIDAWGLRGANSGQFEDPCGITVDGNTGNIWVADTWNHRMQKFDRKGKFLCSIQGELYGPRDVKVDSSGNIYVSDTGNCQIKKYNSRGNFILKWGQKGSGNLEFDNPWGIAVDSNGEVYVADTGNYKIKVFSSDGNFLRDIDIKPFCKVKPEELYLFLSKSYVFVSNSNGNSILLFDKHGKGAKIFEAVKPAGLIVTSKGEIIYTNSENNRLSRLGVISDR